MKIGIFADNFLPETNGVVTSIISIAKGLADKGHSIYIFAPKYKKKCSFQYPNVQVVRTTSIPFAFYPDMRVSSLLSPKILAKVIKDRIDIIYFAAPLTLGLQAALISKTLKLPLVGTYHTIFSDMDYLKHAKIDYHVFEKTAWKYARAVYNLCDLITVPSPIIKKLLMNHNFKPKIKYISNGIDLSIFDNIGSAKIKKKYGINGKLLLYIGRIAHEKNIMHLLKSFSLVINKYENVQLMLVGGGPQLGIVKKEVRNLKLTKKVIITGSIPYDKLIKSGIYGAADLFITASKTENQPMTILEAQANSLVCVGVKERGIPDLIKNGVNGYVVDSNNEKEFAEAVIKLLSNRKTYLIMKENTMRLIKNHDINKVIDIWEKTFFEIFKSRRN